MSVVRNDGVVRSSKNEEINVPGLLGYTSDMEGEGTTVLTYDRILPSIGHCDSPVEGRVQEVVEDFCTINSSFF